MYEDAVDRLHAEQEAHRKTREDLDKVVEEKNAMVARIEAFKEKASSLFSRVFFLMGIPMFLTNLNFQVIHWMHPSKAVILPQVSLSLALAASSLIMGLTGNGLVWRLKALLKRGIGRMIDGVSVGRRPDSTPPI